MRTPRPRPSTNQRGYDGTHKAIRRQWEPAVANGMVTCRRGDQCLEGDPRIYPGQLWDLGHPDRECPAPIAPEHMRCNRAAGARNAARKTNTARAFTVRGWTD